MTNPKVDKSERSTKFFTMLAVVVLFVLILVLVTTLVQRSQLVNKKAELEKSIKDYKSEAEGLTEEFEKRSTLEYIEQKARELGLIGEDETLHSTGK